MNESVEMNNLETDIDPLHSSHNLDGIPYQLAKLEDTEHDETPILNQEEEHPKQIIKRFQAKVNSNVQSSPNKSRQSEDVSILPILRRICDLVQFVDPDTNELSDYVVIS